MHLWGCCGTRRPEVRGWRAETRRSRTGAVKRLAIAAVALLILTVAALVIFADRGDHHQVDVKAWQAELRDEGDNGLSPQVKRHWQEYQAWFVRECGLSFEALGILLTVN